MIAGKQPDAALYDEAETEILFEDYSGKELGNFDEAATYQLERRIAQRISEKLAGLASSRVLFFHCNGFDREALF
jgi:hypothetical protein